MSRCKPSPSGLRRDTVKPKGLNETFSQSQTTKEFADTQGKTIGPKGTAEIATYTSLTEWRGVRILWYPDRKYFLLGKRINDDWLGHPVAK